MAINGSGGNSFPAAILDVMEQKNYLQTFLRKALAPNLVFRPKKIGPNDWFSARVGETKTFSRTALIAPSITPLNPANNTGLDNGMTADVRSYEQWTATLNEYPGFIPTNILGQETMLADLYLDNMAALAQKAASSLELLCVSRFFNAYDSGDTFVSSGVTGATIRLDNINGFTTQYPASDAPLYKTPQAVSSGNPLYVAILSESTGLVTYATTVQAYAADGTNVSSMQTGGIAYGQSGTVTLGQSVTVAKGDRIVAVDPSYTPVVGQVINPVYKDSSTVIRPLNGSGNQITTEYDMAATSVMNPSLMIPAAVAILKRRGIPPLPNGLYGCAVDSTLLASFYGDTGFQRATATNWDRGSYFTNGITAKGWGVEFTDAQQIPVYQAPAGSFALRHAAVFGQDAISEHPFVGAKNAADIVAGVGDVADERWADRIKFRSLAAIDTLGQVIKTAYDYVGDFQCGTDKSSNPAVVQSSDYTRFKRGVVLQASTTY
jgi:hypothetical protein